MHILGCRLVDCNANADSLPVTAQAAEVESSAGPDDVGEVLTKVVIFAVLIVLFSILINVITATDKCSLNEEY